MVVGHQMKQRETRKVLHDKDEVADPQNVIQHSW